MYIQGSVPIWVQQSYSIVHLIVRLTRIILVCCLSQENSRWSYIVDPVSITTMGNQVFNSPIVREYRIEQTIPAIQSDGRYLTIMWRNISLTYSLSHKFLKSKNKLFLFNNTLCNVMIQNKLRVLSHLSHIR